METKEYIVILHSHTDLDDFYTDMEQQGHYEYAPNRAVDLVHRRPASRSTHYQLTDDEVQILRQDPRVLDIHRPYYDLGYEVVPCVSQYSDYWSKGSTETGLWNARPEMNWGLLRCVEGKTRDNWGVYYDFLTYSRKPNEKVSGTVNLPNTGRHVDLVIVDGHIDPTHPEFAKNPDGTGGSRVIQYKWFKEHWQQVLGTRPTKTVDGVESFNDYEYDIQLNNWRAISSNNHGALDAAIAAGNTCGFARGANIYNISPYYDTTINGDWCDLYNIASFIEEFHKNKQVNPVTGRKNPTIANLNVIFYHQRQYSADAFREIRYKGQTYTRDNITRKWSQDAFRKTGAEWLGWVQTGARDNSIDQDVMDAIAAGVIFTAAAGNEKLYMDRPGSVLYDTEFVEAAQNSDGSYNKVYPHRGVSPGSAPGVICVGALDAEVEEKKASYSNKGPRIDIYAPAVNTTGVRLTLTDYTPQTIGYFKGRFDGTSAAAPHVVGIIACALETYPNMTQTQALSYIQNYADHGLLRDRPFNTDYEADQWANDERILFNGPNMHARYRPNTRPNQVYPVNDAYQSRPATGLIYPRLGPNKSRPTTTTTTTPAPITTTTTPAPITTTTTLAPITTTTTLANT